MNSKLLEYIGGWFIESLGQKKVRPRRTFNVMNMVMINNRCYIHHGRDIHRRRLCCSRRRRLS